MDYLNQYYVDKSGNVSIRSNPFYLESYWIDMNGNICVGKLVPSVREETRTDSMIFTYWQYIQLNWR
jgi:hypothetical protein